MTVSEELPILVLDDKNISLSQLVSEHGIVKRHIVILFLSSSRGLSFLNDTGACWDCCDTALCIHREVLLRLGWDGPHGLSPCTHQN